MTPLLFVILLSGCRASADDNGTMGDRYTDGVEQPKNIAPGWRCDLFRGFRDWPSGVSCHPAVGYAEHIDPPANGYGLYIIDNDLAWPPDGLVEGWDCAAWGIGETLVSGACYLAEGGV